MKSYTVEVFLDGHAVLHWEGMMTKEDLDRLHADWDNFWHGEHSREDCRAKFENAINFAGFSKNDRNPFKDEVCNYPDVIAP